MSSNIQNLLEKNLGDGGRSTKFDAIFQFTSQNQPDSEFVASSVKTTSFPGKSHTPIHIKMGGRPVPVRGHVKYSQEWSCTFYLTDNHELKNVFELWLEALDEKHHYNDSVDGMDALIQQHKSYGFYRDISVYQLSFDETEQMSKYEMHNAFPIRISEVDVSYEGTSKVLEFTVTFAFTHYTHSVTSADSGNFLDGIISKIQSSVSSTISSNLTEFANQLISGETVGDVSNIFANVTGLSSDTSTYSKMFDMFNTGGVNSDNMPNSLNK